MQNNKITPGMVRTAFQQECQSNRDAVLSKTKINALKKYFMIIAKGYCPNFTVKEEHTGALNEIFLWCIDAQGRLDPNKGLWLWGENGTGKTTMLYIIKEFCRQIGKKDPRGSRYGFRITNANAVSGAFNQFGYEGIDEYITTPRQAFDELGSEPQLTGHYGTPMNVMQYVLQRRYDTRFNDFTHVTTNLRIEEIADIYGARIYDRCKEMFNFVYLGGRTNRKFTNKI